jgi:hypothetical protein
VEDVNDILYTPKGEGAGVRGSADKTAGEVVVQGEYE